MSNEYDLTAEEIRKRVAKLMAEVAPESRVLHEEYHHSTNDIFVIWSSWGDVETFNKVYIERFGEPDGYLFEAGFNDEYDTCSECNNLIRTAPDCYAWQPEFFYFEFYGNVCDDCIRSDFETEYIDAHICQNRLLNDYLVDPARFGWVKLDLRFENGLHHGQNADPQAITRLLNLEKIPHLFTGSVGQFDVNFYVWVNREHTTRAMILLEENNTNLPYDQATEMKKALSGRGSDYITVVERQLTPEEFVSGDWAREETDGPTKTTIDYGENEDGSQ